MDTLQGTLAQKYSVFSLKPASKELVSAAEKELGLSFPAEYKEYLERYGCLSFSSHEITGLGVDGYLNVVQATMDERRLDSSFPRDCFLIENLGIDGILILQNTHGEILEYKGRQCTKIFDTLKEYLLSV